MNRVALRAAWSAFLAASAPTFAVSIAYNNRYNGTSTPCYRLTPDGEYVQLRGSSRLGVTKHRLPMIRYVPLDQVHADLHRLHRNVDRRLFGTRFNRPGSPRTSFTGFIESASDNIHAHLGWTVPASRIAEFEPVVRDAWIATSPYVSIKIVPVRDSGWSDYVCKCQTALDGDAALFVSDPVFRS